MPFEKQIAEYINQQWAVGCLGRDDLQPVVLHGLATPVYRRKKGATENQLEKFPALITSIGGVVEIVPDDSLSIQVYHKIVRKAYSYEKTGYGDSYHMKCTAEMEAVIINNVRRSGATNDTLEPVLIFSIPQRISKVMTAEYKLNNCLITPQNTNHDALSVFLADYPSFDFFLNEWLSMFSIRYKIETTFGQACMEKCLCDN